MALNMKTTNYLFLEKVGVPQDKIQELKTNAISIGLSFFEIQFFNMKGIKLSSYKMAASANDIMKGKVSKPVLEVIKGGILNAMNAAVLDPLMGYLSPDTTKPMGIPGTKTLSELAGQEPAKVEAVLDTLGAKSKVAKKPAKVEPIPLALANEMYCAVRGSSAGSVYYMVAANAQVRVGVRVKGKDISVRVEGTLNAEIVSAFAKVAVTKKHGDYLSGHFTMNETTNPERLLGAILMGTGLEYTTPMPTIKKVMAK